MRAEDLQKLLNQRPWRPLRVHFTNGEHIDLRHPEMAMVGRSFLAIGVGKGPGEIVDVVYNFSLLHIVKVVPVNGDGRVRRQHRKR